MLTETEWSRETRAIDCLRGICNLVELGHRGTLSCQFIFKLKAMSRVCSFFQGNNYVSVVVYFIL